MSRPTPQQALRVPGQLSWAPTDLTDAATGTQLGQIRSVVWRRVEVGRRVIEAVEYGGEPSDVVRGGVRVVLTAFLQSMDDDALDRVFPGTFEASTTNRRSLREPSTTRPPGSLASDRAGVLAFVPNDVSAHHGLVLYNAIPLAAEEVEVTFGQHTDVLIAVEFLATRDSSGRLYELVPLEDATAP